MIQSVKRTFDILEYIAANGNMVRLNDIAQALGLGKTTVHNFLSTLKELGYVQQDDLTPRYRITAKIYHLDFSDIPYHKLRSDLKPIMEKITADTGETSFLATQMGSYFRYEFKCEPNRSLKISLELGKEYEMQHTAIGKIFMAYSPHLSGNIYKTASDSENKTQNDQIQDIIKNGYALDLEEYEKELNCVALPVFYKDKIIAAIGLSGPAHRFDKKKIKEVAEQVKKLIAV